MAAEGGGGGGPAPPSIDPPPGSGATLTSIAITPQGSVVKVGETLQLYAIGNYSDGGQLDLTSEVTWLGSTLNGITFSPTGLVTAHTATFSSSRITATHVSSGLSDIKFVYVSSYGLEGSIDSPAVITEDVAHNGEVNFGGPSVNGYSYYTVNVTPDNAYYFFLENLSRDVSLKIYDDAAFSNVVCTSDKGGTADELCVAIAPVSGIFYIIVDGNGTRDTSDRGASYTLTVRPGYMDEPASDNIIVPLNTPYNGQIGRYVYDDEAFTPLMYGISFYEIPVTPTGRYTVNITSLTGDVEMVVLSSISEVLCASNNAGTADEACSFQTERTPAYIRVDEVNTLVGASYTLTVTEDHGAYISEGTVVSPIDITGSMPYHGHVGGINSYYSVNVTPNQSYEVRGSGLDGELGLYAGNISNFNSWDCSDFSGSNPTKDVVCRFEPATTSTLYIRMTPNGGIGTEYFLNVTSTAYTAENTTLLETPDKDTPYAGQVDDTSSQYEIPVNTGKLYRVGLSTVSGDITLNVYDDIGHTALLCTSNNTGIVDEYCLTEPSVPSGTNIYVEIIGSTYGSKFNLTVDRVYRQEGGCSKFCVNLTKADIFS
ncbi:MAG: Ig-like domain-containing protein [Deltaproteobacteria bacterium]|nr:Ig-like domain-containing protein [Deltaproteobacteria bacterium]